jgi:hypothetical protein
LGVAAIRLGPMTHGVPVTGQLERIDDIDPVTLLMGTLDEQLVVAVSRFDRDPHRPNEAAQPFLNRFPCIVDTLKITLVGDVDV